MGGDVGRPPPERWLDVDDGGLNQGLIAVINLNALSSYYFQVKLEDKPGAHYAMLYDYDSILHVHGNVRFSKIFERMLLTFDGESFYEFLSVRMCNFMLRSIKTNGWMPK